jgi:IQ domain-containing protein G
MTSALNPLEAMRAAAVLSSALERLAFLPAVTPDVLAHRGEVSALVGDEISRIINEQRALEQRYDTLIGVRVNLRGLANKSKFKEVQEEIAQVSADLRESLRNLCRALKDNPDIADSLALVGEERDALQALLARTLSDVKDGGHFRSLADFVQREREQRERLAEIARREDAAAREVDVLAATLKEEEDRHAYEAELKRAEINTLKERLRKLKVDTTMTLRFSRKEVAARNETLGRQFAGDEGEVAKEIEELKSQLAQESAAHETTLELLKREQEEYAKKVEEWKGRHAADMAAKAEELVKVTAARDEQRLKLEALQDRYEADLQAMVDKQVRGKGNGHGGEGFPFTRPPHAPRAPAHSVSVPAPPRAGRVRVPQERHLRRRGGGGAPEGVGHQHPKGPRGHVAHDQGSDGGERGGQGGEEEEVMRRDRGGEGFVPRESAVQGEEGGMLRPEWPWVV